MDTVIRECLLEGLHVERLMLRPLCQCDAQDMFAYTSDPQTCQFLNWGPHTSLMQAENFIEKALREYADPKDILWGIEHKGSGRMIGVVRIYDITHDAAYVSYILNRSFSGNGYMTEVVSAVMEMCFNRLNLVSVYADYVEGNDRSMRVMQRCGMQPCDKGAHVAWIKGKELQVKTYEKRRSTRP